jgi:hypothetical protein
VKRPSIDTNYSRPLLELVKSNTSKIKTIEAFFFSEQVMKYANTKGRVSLNEFPLSSTPPYLHATADDLKSRAASMTNSEIGEKRAGSGALLEYNADAIKVMDKNDIEHTKPVYFQLLKAFWILMHYLYSIEVYTEPWARDPENSLILLINTFNLSELVVNNTLTNVNANLDQLFRNIAFPEIKLFDSDNTNNSIYDVYSKAIVRNEQPYMVVHTCIYTYIKSVEVSLLQQYKLDTIFLDQRDKLFGHFTMDTEKYMFGCLRLVIDSYEAHYNNKNKFEHLIELHQEIFETNILYKDSATIYSAFQEKRAVVEKFVHSLVTEDIWGKFTLYFKRNSLKMDKARELKALKLRAQKRHDRVMNQIQRNLKSTITKKSNVAAGSRLSDRMERLSRPTKIHEKGLINRLQKAEAIHKKEKKEEALARVAAAAAAAVKPNRNKAKSTPR